jgi:hypothetical protein
MIEVPPNTTCYYTVKLQGEAMLSTLHDLFPVKSGTFDHAVVVSVDMDSDIEATNAVEHAGANLIGSKWKDSRSFNPLYLPMERDKLVEQVETDTDGNLVAVGRFEDPFETYFLERAEPESVNAFTGKVVYHEFKIPHPMDVSQPWPQRYLA